MNNKKLFKAIAINYSFVSFFLIMGILSLQQYMTCGCLSVKGFYMYGKDAQITAWLLLFGGVTVFIYYTLLIFGIMRDKRLRATYRADIEKPHYLICLKCNKTYSGHNVVNLICPNCGGDVEDVKGFYNRHPEKMANDSYKSIDESKESELLLFQWQMTVAIVLSISLFLLWVYFK